MTLSIMHFLLLCKNHRYPFNIIETMELVKFTIVGMSRLCKRLNVEISLFFFYLYGVFTLFSVSNVFYTYNSPVR